jgi:hypothetical protein
MKLNAVLADDLSILTAALDEPGTDLAQTLQRLTFDATAAIPTYLGLTVTMDGTGTPFTFTTLSGGDVMGDVRTSLGLALPGVGDASVFPAVVLVLYAGLPGTFIDLAADLAWLTARPLSDFVLDQHLLAPAGTGTGTDLLEASVINQAIGALIGQDYTLHQAERHLEARAADAGISRHAASLRILADLTSRFSADDGQVPLK